LFNKTMYL